MLEYFRQFPPRRGTLQYHRCGLDHRAGHLASSRPHDIGTLAAHVSAECQCAQSIEWTNLLGTD